MVRGAEGWRGGGREGGGGAADAFPLSPVIDFSSGSQQFSARLPGAELLLPPPGGKKELPFKDVADDTAGAPNSQKVPHPSPPSLRQVLFIFPLCPKIKARKKERKKEGNSPIPQKAEYLAPRLQPPAKTDALSDLLPVMEVKKSMAVSKQGW